MIPIEVKDYNVRLHRPGTRGSHGKCDFGECRAPAAHSVSGPSSNLSTMKELLAACPDHVDDLKSTLAANAE